MIPVLSLASPMARWLLMERYIYILGYLTDAFMSVQSGNVSTKGQGIIVRIEDVGYILIFPLVFHKLTQIVGY